MSLFDSIVMKSGSQVVLNKERREAEEAAGGDSPNDGELPIEAAKETNAGTVLAIAGDDFVVVAADTRLSVGSMVLSREQRKLFPYGERSMLACAGSWRDAISLTGLLSVHAQLYELTHNRPLSTDALAQMISVAMYKRRLCPYATCPVLAGLDVNGAGAVYYYDPVGHCERCSYRALGSAGVLLMPTLDQALGWASDSLVPITGLPALTSERALRIAHDSLIIASERDTHTGDRGIIQLINKEGIQEHSIELHQD